MPNLTDAMLEGSILFPAPLPSTTLTDFVVGSRPANQALAAGTTTTTIDFAYATGDTTSGTPTLTLLKPSGSSASGSVTNTGSVWRVSLSSLANGEAYTAILEYTSTSGQVARQACLVGVAADSAPWATLVDLDLTTCTTQAGLGTDGTRTIVVGGQNVTLVTSHSTGTEATTTATLTNGTGLVVTHTPSATTPPQNRTFGFDLSTLYGSDINPDRNQVCLEAVIEVSSMPTNNDQIALELGEVNPISSNNPGYTVQLRRASSTSYLLVSGYRQTSSATLSTGQTFKTSAPTAFHAQLIGMGYSFEACAEEATSTSNPFSPSLKGNCGGPTVAPADSSSPVWGTSQWAQITCTGYANAASVVFTIKRIRLLAKQPLV